MHIHSAFYRCTLPQNLRFKLNIKIHTKITNLRGICTRRQNSAWNLLFSYEFLQNEFESQILWQCTSIDAVWMSIILIFLKAPKYVYLGGFQDCTEDVGCTEHFPLYHICHIWACIMEEVLPTFLDSRHSDLQQARLINHTSFN
jgi:hypothetical protein